MEQEVSRNQAPKDGPHFVINRFNARILAIYCIFSNLISGKKVDSVENFFNYLPEFREEGFNFPITTVAYSEMEQNNLKFTRTLVEEISEKLAGVLPLIHSKMEQKRPLAKLEEVIIAMAIIEKDRNSFPGIAHYEALAECLTDEDGKKKVVKIISSLMK